MEGAVDEDAEAANDGGIKSPTSSSRINGFDDFRPRFVPLPKSLAQNGRRFFHGGPAWTVQCETEECC